MAAASPYREATPAGVPTMHVAPPTPIGGSWAHSRGGAVRVGGRPGAAFADPSQETAWQPPPVPAGYYNPIRDIELAEGQRGSEQSITGLDRQKTVGENTYATNLGLLAQREQQQQDSAKQTLARLAEGYAKLGARQGEQANKAGVVNGGALISATTKRVANEGVQKAADERAFAQQRQQLENERGRLATGENQLVGPGGSLVEAIQNARTNQQAFANSVGTLKGNEAAAHGYRPPQRPWVKVRGGSVRVGGKY